MWVAVSCLNLATSSAVIWDKFPIFSASWLKKKKKNEKKTRQEKIARRLGWSQTAYIDCLECVHLIKRAFFSITVQSTRYVFEEHKKINTCQKKCLSTKNIKMRHIWPLRCSPLFKAWSGVRLFHWRISFLFYEEVRELATQDEWKQFITTCYYMMLLTG